jgi:hypothetical protein
MGSLANSELARAERVATKGALLAGKGADWDVLAAGADGFRPEADSTQDTGIKWSNPTLTSSGVGAAAGTGVSAVETGNGAVHKTVLTLAALSIAITDNGVAGGQGSQKVYDFPEGVIQVLGASYNLTTARVSTGIAATAALVGSLGSVAAGAGDATLTSTEADIIASTTGTLTAGAGTLAKHGSLIATAFDGHTTALDAILNLAIPDAGISATDAVLVSGTITMVWANLGDY